MTTPWDDEREERYQAALRNLVRVFAESEGEPSDDHLLPEYVPLPEAEDEVVVVVMPEKPRQGAAPGQPGDEYEAAPAAAAPEKISAANARAKITSSTQVNRPDGRREASTAGRSSPAHPLETGG